MQTQDYTAFAESLRTTAELFGRKLGDGVVRMYFETLASLPVERALIALRSVARQAEANDRFPMPKQLRAVALGGAIGAKHAAVTLGEDQRSRIMRAVFTALHAWEQQRAHGPARPIFEAAWRRAVQAEGLRRVATSEREAIWKKWLEAGEPLTAESKARILEFVGVDSRSGFGQAVASLPISREREPGEDDGEDEGRLWWREA